MITYVVWVVVDRGCIDLGYMYGIHQRDQCHGKYQHQRHDRSNFGSTGGWYESLVVIPNIMKIILHKMSGNKRCEVELPEHATVGDLRQAVRDREAFPFCGCSFSLVSGTMVLENMGSCKALARLGIKSESTVDLLINEMSFARQLGQITYNKVTSDHTRDRTLATWNKRKAELMKKIESTCLDRASAMCDFAEVELFEFMEDGPMMTDIRYGLNSSQSLGCEVDFLRTSLYEEVLSMGFQHVSISEERYPGVIVTYRAVMTLKWDLVT